MKVAWFDFRLTKIQMLGEVLLTLSSSHQLSCCVTVWSMPRAGLFLNTEFAIVPAQQGEKLHREKWKSHSTLRDKRQPVLHGIDRYRSIHMFFLKKKKLAAVWSILFNKAK